MKPADLDSIAQAAATWVSRRDTGFSREEAAEFDRWWRADTRHATAVARLEAADHRLRGLAQFKQDAAFRALLPTNAPARTSGRWAVWIPWGIAASLLAWLFVSRPGTPAGSAGVTSFSTTDHGYQRLMIAGTMVQLNARSLLRVTPDGSSAELVHGEAAITVLPGARVFALKAGRNIVQSGKGTFAVQLSGEELGVMVSAGTAELAGGANDRLTILVGERLSLRGQDRSTIATRRLRPAEMQEVLSWQAPRLAFADTKLTDAIEQFNLYNWEQFQLADRALGAARIGGVFRADVPEDFVAYLLREHRIATERIRVAPSSDPNAPAGAVLSLRGAP